MEVLDLQTWDFKFAVCQILAVCGEVHSVTRPRTVSDEHLAVDQAIGGQSRPDPVTYDVL